MLLYAVLPQYDDDDDVQGVTSSVLTTLKYKKFWENGTKL